MSWFSNFFGSLTGQPAQDAAAQNSQLYQNNYNTGLGYLNQALNQGTGALNQGRAAWDPVTGLANQFGGQYGQAYGAYSDALGLNGTEGNQRAVQNFQAGPGYQWGRDQALEAATRGSAARSMGSLGGNTLDALSRLGSNLANQEYGTYLGRLGGLQGELGNRSLLANNAAATGISGNYKSLADLYNQFGQNVTNLGTTTASGQANSNMQSAQAQQQGASNVLNFGGALATGGAGSNWFANLFRPKPISSATSFFS